MRKTALERVFLGNQSYSVGALFRANGEILWDSFTDYRIWRERKWAELGGTRGVKSKDNPKGVSEKRFEQIKVEFNDLAAEEAETEITLPHPPVKLESLNGAAIKPVDLWAMQDLGLIDKNG